MAKIHNSICLIAVYWGEWPSWISLFLDTARGSPQVDWLLCTDCGALAGAPQNVTVVHTSFEKFRLKVLKSLGLRSSVTERYTGQGDSKPFYKLCDYKPFYGHILEDVLDQYQYWGFCDVDVAVGEISNYILAAADLDADVISCRQGATIGHCTVFRNTSQVKNYVLSPLTRHILACKTYVYYDEHILSSTLRFGVFGTTASYLKQLITWRIFCPALLKLGVCLQTFEYCFSWMYLSLGSCSGPLLLPLLRFSYLVCTVITLDVHSRQNHICDSSLTSDAFVQYKDGLARVCNGLRPKQWTLTKQQTALLVFYSLCVQLSVKAMLLPSCRVPTLVPKQASARVTYAHFLYWKRVWQGSMHLRNARALLVHRCGINML